MASYKNFYETLNEALIRLKNTVILYDGEPYYVITITDHKNDGAFRIYMCDIEDAHKTSSIPALHNFPHGHASLGAAMDQHAVDGNSKIEGLTIIRKKMDSPHFNRFRPFPLGMMNLRGKSAVYVERQPARPKTEQGLTSGMLKSTLVSSASVNTDVKNVNMFTKEFRDCILGDYPSPNECLEALTNSDTTNESVAFHREFALIRGPMDILFIGYRGDVVGALLEENYSKIRLGTKFHYLKEVVTDLRLFSSIEV